MALTTHTHRILHCPTTLQHLCGTSSASGTECVRLQGSVEWGCRDYIPSCACACVLGQEHRDCR